MIRYKTSGFTWVIALLLCLVVPLAVGSAAFPSSRLVAPAVLLQFIVAAIASVPYVRRLKRIGAQQRQPAPEQVRAPAAGAARSSGARDPRPTRHGPPR